jgi:hypothetical protein
MSVHEETHDQKQPPTASAEVEHQHWLAGYRPRGVPSEVWDGGVGSFVRRALEELPAKGLEGVKRDALVRAQLAVWCVEEGLPLEAEVVLDPLVVERFVTLGGQSARTRSTYRSVLRRLGPVLTVRAPWEPRPARIVNRSITPPYLADEVNRLWDDIQLQPTQARRRAAAAIFLLGIGAGLDGRWITKITGADVARRSTVVLVAVPPPSPRTVAAHRLYEERLADLALDAGDGPLVGGPMRKRRNWIGQFQSRVLLSARTPRFSASRLRSTWLLNQITAGTRLPELAAAAGLETVTVLSDLMGFVEPLDEESANQMLRGPQ